MLSEMMNNKFKTLKKQLKERIESKAVLRRSPPEEPFKLASGGTSYVFFDCKLVTQDPKGLALIAELLFEMVKDYDIDGIGGIETGAIPMCTAVSLLSALKGHPIPAFWVRQMIKSHGTKKKIEGELQRNSRVVIVDDVTTKGNSLWKAVEEVLELNCEIVEIISMVDREQGASAKFENNGFKFTPLFKMSEFIS